MSMFVVVSTLQGVISEVRTFSSIDEAQGYAWDAAREMDLLQRPSGYIGRWNQRRGDTRTWVSHWYDDESNVVVAEVN